MLQNYQKITVILWVGSQFVQSLKQRSQLKYAIDFFFRFADVLGLDLDEVKTFLDEIPKVPKSAYNDLKDAELSDLESSASDSGSEPVTMSRFQVRY